MTIRQAMRYDEFTPLPLMPWDRRTRSHQGFTMAKPNAAHCQFHTKDEAIEAGLHHYDGAYVWRILVRVYTGGKRGADANYLESEMQERFVMTEFLHHGLGLHPRAVLVARP